MTNPQPPPCKRQRRILHPLHEQIVNCHHFRIDPIHSYLRNAPIIVAALLDDTCIVSTLEFSRIHNDDAFIKTIIHGIKDSIGSLETLLFEKCTLQYDDTLESILTLLDTTRFITEVRFNLIHASYEAIPRQALRIAQVLLSNPANFVNSLQFYSPPDHLKLDYTRRQRFCLYNVPIRSLTEIQQLTDALTKNDSITELGLHNCRIQEETIWAVLAGFVKRTQTVEIFELDGMNANGAILVANAMKENTSIFALGIQGVDLQESVSESIADLLLCNKTLTYLELGGGSSTNRKPCSITAILKALKSESDIALLQFCLTKMDICNSDVLLLADMLKTNTTLLDLQFTHTNMGNLAAKVLAKAMIHNTTLRDMKLQGNRVGNIGLVALEKVLKVNASLKELVLIEGDDKGEASGIDILSNAFKYNVGVKDLTWSCDVEDRLDRLVRREARKFMH
eukprot:CAMPEP_0118717396 /NCGR_PEP_ID=MMETSP0800-20121206/28119_1 /TAXON_ID=210618 ORGANISM="Striatella unipunctata, Strain CCMP2910" /NCGR_SAMPLE_ID=MMETSP0800 /ASSEMBLY_ACC=CAM_ASM_000638 /LENGTH=451 /DNA_ID=CAMNT_0006624095 /DNA_START=21 /DNA_END=1376 /DNA_ORIENTATION=+